MLKRWRFRLILTFCFSALGHTASQPDLFQPLSNVPNFAHIQPVALKKKQFFNYMAELGTRANREILAVRKKIKWLFKQPTLSPGQQQWLTQVAKTYQLKRWDVHAVHSRNELLSRVDVVPLSLLLAQAANESAWGSSRFAQQGHNYFGQWCYQRHCGIVPQTRPKGATYEVRRFLTPYASVKSYVHNLNVSFSYALFRKLRYAQRQQNQAIRGNVLVSGLAHYSARGQAYVKDIQKMITFNHLGQYDTAFKP